MFKNYIKVAVRTLMKNKLFTFINVFGLALSMCVCMLVLVHIKEQLAYDTFHPQSEKIYRILSQITNEQGKEFRFAASPLPFLGNLEGSYDIVDKSARVYIPGRQQARWEDKKQLEINGAFCDADFFSLFGFRFKAGGAASSLQLPNHVVLTKSMAAKMFGNTVNPIGETIDIPAWGQFIVSGVLEQSPAKSHLDYEAYFSMSSVPALEKAGKIKPLLELWDNFSNSYTYIRVKPGVSEKQLNNAVAAVSARLMAAQHQKGNSTLRFSTQAFDDIILGEELIAEAGNTGSRGKMLAEIAITLIILVSACFNYTNLSIARSLNRGKEVGIRKVAGARRWNVFMQFIMESFIVAFLSFGLAYVLLRLGTDFSPFVAEVLPNGFQFDGSIFVWFLLFTVFTGLVAGIIPAWTLSSFKPVQVLKNLSTIKLFGSNSLRKSLIVVQFVLCMVIVIFTMVFGRQFDYMANADPLFKRSNIINISLQGMDPLLLIPELKSISGVEQVIPATEVPGKNVSGTVGFKLLPSDNTINVSYYDASAGFVSAFGLQLLAGSNFAEGTDISTERYTIINERMLEFLHVKNAGDAIGKQLLLSDSATVQVRGVVRDFYFKGMEWAPGPLILRNRHTAPRQLVIQTSADHAQTLAAVQLAWKKIFPYQEFNGDWLLRSTRERYAATGTKSMLSFLSFITITIACLGLLGMVTYITRTRYKEIGIRKVMGAGVGTILLLLSRGFLKLIMIAAAIGLPLGYVAGYFFLNIFSNRVSLGLDLLLYGLAGILGLVLITIGWQIYKVAMANPVESLRSE